MKIRDKNIRTFLVFLMIGILFFAPPVVSAQSSEFNFIAYGDTRGDAPDSISSIHEDLVNAFLQEDPEFVIHTGDLVNHGGEAYQWPIFNDSIGAIWDAGIPLYAAVGNHEYYTDDYGVNDEDFSTYREYVDYSDVIDEAGENELYYSFDHGGIHFIVLNTEDEVTSNIFSCSETQMSWLLGDLANFEPDDFIVVLFHRPAFSIRTGQGTPSEAVRNEFHSLFMENGVDLVFSGHDHFYYRTVRDGIYYVTTGGGGAPPYIPDKTSPTWQTGDIATEEFHYCNVEVSASQVITTVSALNGTVIDQFAIERPYTPTSIPLTWFALVAEGGIILILLVVLLKFKRR